MTAEELQRTALTSRHEQADAQFAPFAGWAMPLEYEGTLAEHAAVRDQVGIFDVSHLGTVLLRGAGAAAAIGRSFTCDPGRVDVGRSQYTLCCDEDGGVVDDLIVYRLEDDQWMVVPNAANTAAVRTRLEESAALAGEVTLEDRSVHEAIVAVQGPQALSLASEVLGVDVSAIPYLGVARSDAAASRGAVVARTGYTGEPGCEVVAPGPLATTLWDRLVAAGAARCGLGARDTLRLEMGYPLHGNELSRDVDPYQARLGWAVHLDHEFVGREALVEARASGPSRRLWGLLVDGRRPLRRGLRVRSGGAHVGEVTSGSFSPTLQAGIGLAYLADPLGPGDEAVVDVRGRDVAVQVVRPPFVERDPRG